jgi:Sjoegren syndrome nuclear autoantigen 1
LFCNPFARAALPPSLSNYNQELVRCIEDLREKREEVNRSILRDEEEKAKIQRELTKMTERLGKLNEDLARKMQARAAAWRLAPRPTSLPYSRTPPLLPCTRHATQARVEFDQTIQETEAAYMKILESSQTLLGVLKRESTTLTKKKTASS